MYPKKLFGKRLKINPYFSIKFPSQFFGVFKNKDVQGLAKSLQINLDIIFIEESKPGTRA